MVENQIDRKIKTLRTDNGLEFYSRAFDVFCNNHGILRHKIVRNTPQQNGVAECMNRTLFEKVRCLIFISNLSKSFWGEALSTAAHIVNKRPSTTLKFKCPEEQWTGKKLNLNYLRVFGCEVYAH